MALTKVNPGDKITAAIYNANAYYLLKGTPTYEDTVRLADNVAGTFVLQPNVAPGSPVQLFQVATPNGSVVASIDSAGNAVFTTISGTFTLSGAATFTSLVGFAAGLQLGNNQFLSALNSNGVNRLLLGLDNANPNTTKFFQQAAGHFVFVPQAGSPAMMDLDSLGNLAVQTAFSVPTITATTINASAFVGGSFSGTTGVFTGGVTAPTSVASNVPVKIATITPVVGVDTVASFTGIPAVFSRLEVVGRWRWHTASNAQLSFRFNNDSGGNYDTFDTSSNLNQTQGSLNLGPGSGQTAGWCSAFVAKLPNYAGTSLFKQVLISLAVIANSEAGISAGQTGAMWKSTAAINRIDLGSFSGVTFETGTTFDLWGYP